MALEFKVYERAEGTLENIGTLATMKVQVAFIPSNFDNPEKSVALVLKDKSGKSAVLPCSKAISRKLRAAKAQGKTNQQLISALSALPIYENAEGMTILGTEGTELVFFDIAQAVKTAKVTYEDLIA